MHRIESLKHLALLGALGRPIKISSSEFTRYTSTSSKTAARTLKQLEDEGLIERKIVPSGQLVKIKESGDLLLRQEYLDYRAIFSRDKQRTQLFGHVITGLGEGQYYIAQEGYSKQFEEKLKFIPYPGTLNVRLSDTAEKVTLQQQSIIHIDGFTDGQRTFGACKCYYVHVEGILAAVIVPDRTHYPRDLLEIISPVHLRETLELKDGDEVKITPGDEDREI